MPHRVEKPEGLSTRLIVTGAGHTGHMSNQLVLINTDNESDWRLDDHTVEVGLRGVAAAREVLRQHRLARRPVDPTTPDATPRRAA